MPTSRKKASRTETGRAAHTTLRYFPFNDELYFLRDDEARQFVAMHAAKTWAEFRTGAPTLHAEALERFEHWNEGLHEDDASRVPGDDEPFDLCAIPGVEDGDWPLYPPFAMLQWMPTRIIRAHGEIVQSVLNGPMLRIGEEQEQQVVAALEAEGYVCMRDEEIADRMW